MEIVQALRDGSDFYAKERPRASLCELQTEIGQNECEGIARRLAGAANEIERLSTLVAWIDKKPECRAAQFRGLQDENSILRAALQQFVSMPEKFPEDGFLDGWAKMRAAFANAKAVLQQVT